MNADYKTNTALLYLRNLRNLRIKNDLSVTLLDGNSKRGGLVKKTILALLIIAITAAPTYAASGDDILGIWNNQEKDAKIEVFKCGDKYCGKIVSLKDPNYLPGSTEGTPGTPRVDRNNPDPSLKTRPIIGLQIMNDFIFKGGNEWKGGTVYDPKKGKTYKGKITLVSSHQLNLRGFIGISLIGRTSTWTR